MTQMWRTYGTSIIRPMPGTTKRLLDKLREAEALRGDDHSPTHGPLSRFGKVLVAALRDFVRNFTFHLLAGSLSIDFSSTRHLRGCHRGTGVQVARNIATE